MTRVAIPSKRGLHRSKHNVFIPVNNLRLLDPNPTPFPIPKRWTGKVCLDWSIQLCCHLVPRVCEDKWGDHKMVAYQGHPLFQASKPTARLGPQPDYSKPPDVPLESWVKALEKAWDKNQPCEKNWYTFMNALDRTCTDALRQFLPENSRRLRMAEKHNKQIQPCFSLQHNHHRVHATPGQSIKSARLRRLLASVSRAVVLPTAGSRRAPAKHLQRGCSLGMRDLPHRLLQRVRGCRMDPSRHLYVGRAYQRGPHRHVASPIAQPTRRGMETPR